MIKMSRKAKKAMAVALTAGMLASTAATPVMAATEGWKKNSTGWWYQNADGSWPASKWEKINGAWYYFDANGYMKASSWAQDKAGKWYYLGVNGAMVANSWAQDKAGKWYYLGADGAMKTNAWAPDKAGLWYYVTEDGSMFEGGWKAVGDKTYFFKNDGVMQSGVVKVEGKTYYFGAANDGAMKTGKVSIETVEYNFGEDGACTDTKVPDTIKVFDKAGNPVTPEVEIEKVDGINGAITNAISEYSEYGNVIIAGNDAYFKVLVTQNGEPVVGTPVALTSKRIIGSSFYDVKGLNVATTDAQGYATFVFGVDEEHEDIVTATSNHGALYELTANAVAINKEYKTDLVFANVNLGAVKESTCSATDAHNAIVPAENSKNPEGHSKVVEADGINGLTKSEYVPSQQVSNGTTSDHALTFSVSPQLEIYTRESEEEVDTYHIDVNKTISEYSVYEDGGENEIIIDNIPGEIAYGNLNLENLNISEYTKVEIKTYSKSTDEEIKSLTKVIDGANTSKSVTYQIPRNTVSGDKYIKVRIISEGQVNDDKNGGLTIKDFEGIYDETSKGKPDTISLSNSVTWTQETIKYSEEKTLTETKFRECLQDKDETKYVKNGYNYSYVVPAFPYVGNAIITVKDSNKKVVAYFSLPTENVQDAIGNYTNVNDIKDLSGTIYYPNAAILISEDEALNTVGTITTNGNSVTVNSSEVGVTALKAKINIEGFEDQINLKNNTLYTSVHWAPVPNATEESDDFYALTGQYITVTAQLVDKNGNKSAKADAAVSFTYNKAGKVESVANGTVGEMATAYGLSSTVKTDKNGQVSFKISADDSEALVQGLSASSSSGDVVLTIGGKSVDTANLHWVKPGLAFTSSVNSENTTVDERKVVSDIAGFEGVTTGNFVAADKITENTDLVSELTKEVGSNWIFGFEVVGDTKDTDTKDVWADSIEGLKINLSKDGDATLTTDGLANGVAKITSTKNTPTKLTGKIDTASTSNVVFNIMKQGDTETTAYANVGEGTAKFDSSLTIPIAFGASGLTTDFIFPQGQNIAINTTINTDTTDVYIVAKDSFGNRVPNKAVEYTVTYYAKDASGNVRVIEASDNTPEGSNDTTIEATTDENGLVKVTLEEQAGVTIYQADITVKIDEESAKTEVKFIEAPKTPFAFVSANYVEPAAGETNGTIELAFSSNVLGSSVVSTDMFYVNDDIGELKIKDAKEKDGKIILTLADTNKTLTRGTGFTVTIKDKEDTGITYKLCDVNGRILTNTSVDSIAATNSISVESVDNNGKVTLGNVDDADDVIVVFDGNLVGIGGNTTGCVTTTYSTIGAITYTGAEDTTVTFYSKGAKTELKLEKLAVSSADYDDTTNKLTVTFNREVASAGVAANYSIYKKVNGEWETTAVLDAVTAAEFAKDGENNDILNKVTLTLGTLDAGDYKLVVSNVNGYYTDVVTGNKEATFTVPTAD